jgi:hypothetical protein
LKAGPKRRRHPRLGGSLSAAAAPVGGLAEAFGSYRKKMEAFGSFRKHLEVNGRIWKEWPNRGAVAEWRAVGGVGGPIP